MKSLSLVFFILLLGSCQSSKYDIDAEEFMIKIKEAHSSNLDTKKLVDGWYQTSRTENEFTRIDPKTSESYFINPKPLILPINFKKVEEFENNEGFSGIGVWFEKSGTASWSKATGQNINKHLIYIYKNEILSAPYVNSQIFSGNTAFWKQDFSENDWSKFKSVITDIISQNNKSPHLSSNGVLTH